MLIRFFILFNFVMSLRMMHLFCVNSAIFPSSQNFPMDTSGFEFVEIYMPEDLLWRTKYLLLAGLLHEMEI